MTQNFRGFWYTPSTGTINAVPGAGPGGVAQPGEGASWLNFGGQWGDEKWPTKKFGQYCIADECHIAGGPTGKHAVRAGAPRESPRLTRFTPQVRCLRTWDVTLCARTKARAMSNLLCDKYLSPLSAIR